MRLSMGHIDFYDHRIATFAKQLGLNSVQLHNPSNLPSVDGSWRFEDLRALKDQIEGHGLTLEGLENVSPQNFDQIQQGRPGRDEQIENYLTTIRNMAQAGITLLGYNFLLTYVWRTDMRACGRGGARVSRFDLAEACEGNALAAYKLTPDLDPDLALTEADLWDNHQYFLDAVLPTAEELGVRLALHPDDPPVCSPLGGAPRIFTSPAALERAHKSSHASPSWRLNFCIGTVSEMGGQAAVDEVIDTLGAAGAIEYVHLRDVIGTGASFAECFLGEGNLSIPAVLARLSKNGFDGFIIDDHVPAMLGDVDTWDDTTPEAYCSRGRSYAIGYLQGCLDALQFAGVSI